MTHTLKLILLGMVLLAGCSAEVEQPKRSNYLDWDYDNKCIVLTEKINGETNKYVILKPSQNIVKRGNIMTIEKALTNATISNIDSRDIIDGPIRPKDCESKEDRFWASIKPWSDGPCPVCGSKVIGITYHAPDGWQRNTPDFGWINDDAFAYMIKYCACGYS